MERARRHLVAHAEGGQPLGQLAGCLAREGEGEDVTRIGAAVRHSPGDAAREHARLAGAGAREDAQRRRLAGDGLALAGIEPVEQVLHEVRP